MAPDLKDYYKYLVGSSKPFLISGPCVIENKDHSLYLATKIKEITDRLGIEYIFKASFDKANRTKLDNFRGLKNIEESLNVFRAIKEKLGLKVCTDFHEADQAAMIADVVDIIQIPAFLCRQTDLLVSAAKTGNIVNVKKGQFISGLDTDRITSKIKDSGNELIFLTERGNTFGYNDYVVDFRNIPIMKNFSPVIFDVGHSLQKGCSGGSSGSHMQFAEPLLKAALAIGVDGIFMEVHDDPKNALSDGSTSVKLSELEELLKRNEYLWLKRKVDQIN
tara:strand:- start:1311 stop:2141 length:831 start_codon:yes stop_codon:yes gene_type:complete